MPEKIHRNNLSDTAIKNIRELFSSEPKFTLEGICLTDREILTVGRKVVNANITCCRSMGSTEINVISLPTVLHVPVASPRVCSTVVEELRA